MTVDGTLEETLKQLRGISMGKEQDILSDGTAQAVAEFLVGKDGKALCLMPEGRIHKSLRSGDQKHIQASVAVEGAGEAACAGKIADMLDHVGRVGDRGRHAEQ